MRPALARSDPTPAAAGDLLVAPEGPGCAAAVLDLVDRAFGPGRYAKVSERIRERNRFVRDKSFCAFLDARLVGSVRLWPVSVGGEPGLFLGPIAVETEARRRGVAARLIAAAAAAADAAGARFILLVGDPPLFAPHGFHPAGGVALPGPADPARILLRLGPGASPPTGRAMTPVLLDEGPAFWRSGPGPEAGA